MREKQTIYGTADSVRFFCCPDKHVHVVGYNELNEPEYEIVMGPEQQQRCLNAMKAIRTQKFAGVKEVNDAS